MTVRKGIFRILACPCGFSALQQEENPKVYTCEHCGESQTLDGSPVPPIPLHIEPIVGAVDPAFDAVKEWQTHQDELLAGCAVPPEMLGPTARMDIVDSPCRLTEEVVMEAVLNCKHTSQTEKRYPNPAKCELCGATICPDCNGTKTGAWSRCSTCKGTGVIEEEKP